MAALGGADTAPAEVSRSEWQKSQMSCSLDCRCEHTLMLGTSARAAPGRYSASIGYEVAQPRSVLVVYGIYLARTKGADFADWRVSRPGSSRWPRSG